MIPSYRNEQTGQPILDRIQAALRECIAAVRALNDRVPSLVSVALDRDFTTTSTVHAATPLAFAVQEGETWVIEYAGLAGVSGSANGMTYMLQAPVGSTCSGAMDTSLTSAIDDTHVQFTSVNAATSTVHTVNGGTRDDVMNVRLKAGGPGTVALMVASVTSGNTTTVAAKSWLRATRYRAV